MSRCSGHCCRNFYLPLGPLELHERQSRIKDGTYIAEMVVYLGKDFEGHPGHRYTCRHLDAESGNCLDYPNRPAMCSEYPYEKVCTYKGCTLEQGINRNANA